MENTDPIVYFRGQHHFLSNFFPVELIFNGIHFTTLEHAYQAAKSYDIDGMYNIQQCTTAGKAKRMGQKLELRHDWEEVKIMVMTGLVYKKFRHPELAFMLMDTRDRELIEGNKWGDIFWGRVYKDGKWVGKNNLGKILMEVRKFLRN